MAQSTQQPQQNQNPPQQKGIFGNAMDTIFGNAKVGVPNPSRTTQPNPADYQIPQNVQSNPGNVNVPQNQNVDDPSNQNQQNQQQENKSPLDEFSGIWENPKDKDGKPIVKNNEPLVAFDEAKFSEALKTLDFTKSVDPELMQKALGGDQASLVQIMNDVGKGSLGLTAKMTTSLVEAALKKQETKLRAEMTESFRSNSVKNSLTAENPALNHPALKPMLSSLESQVRAHFPDASSEEVTKHAKTALTRMAEAIVGKTNSNNNDSDSGKSRKTINGTDDVDWDLFASGETSDISKM